VDSKDATPKFFDEDVKDYYKDEKRAPQLLEAGAETFRERNTTYGDNYLTFGRVMAELFPTGLSIEAGDTAAFSRLGVLVQVVGKIGRYANNCFPGGGHKDSAHDLMVYGAMLEEVTDEG